MDDDSRRFEGRSRYDSRSEVLRDAETVFEYIDQNGDGFVTGNEIQFAVDVLRPDLLDKRFQPKSSDLVAILTPEAGRQEPCKPLPYAEIIAHTRNSVSHSTLNKQLLNFASRLILAKGTITRNWWGAAVGLCLICSMTGGRCCCPCRVPVLPSLLTQRVVAPPLCMTARLPARASVHLLICLSVCLQVDLPWGVADAGNLLCGDAGQHVEGPVHGGHADHHARQRGLLPLGLHHLRQLGMPGQLRR
jgi:hypothetical protein